MKQLVLLLVVVALAFPTWTAVQAQAVQHCLSADGVNAILTERNGEAWNYALIDKFGLESAKCVRREQNNLLYQLMEGDEGITVQWVGTKTFGHWYRIIRTERGEINKELNTSRNLPPQKIIRTVIRLGSRLHLEVIKLVTPLELTELRSGPKESHYMFTLWSFDGASWVGKSVWYRPAPMRLADGEIQGRPFASSSKQQTYNQAERLHQQYTPVVMDFIESRFFEEFMTKSP